MSYTQDQWREIAFQHAFSIKVIYCYLATCLQSSTDHSEIVQIHEDLVWKHRDFLLWNQAGCPSDLGKTAVRDTCLVERLWDTTSSCLKHLKQHTSRETLQESIQRMFRNLVLMYESIHHNRSIWAELIAFLAWTAAETGMHEPGAWRDVATRWYKRANRATPGSGRYLLNLAVLEELPLIKLYYFSKSLVSLDAVSSSTAYLEPLSAIHQTVEPPAEILFVKATHLLLLQAAKNDLDKCIHELQKALSSNEQVFELWQNGATIACIMCAALMGFGDSGSPALQAMSEIRTWQHDPGYIIIRESMRLQNWRLYQSRVSTTTLSPPSFSPNPCTSLHDTARGVSTAKLFYLVANAALDARCHSFTYVLLSFIFALSHSPRGLIYLESAIPWRKLVRCLNLMHLEVRNPPISTSAGSLREDVLLHGYMWSWMLFQINGPCESLNIVEASCEVQLRLQLCMHLAQAIVKIQRYVVFHQESGYHLSLHAKVLEQQQDAQ